MKKLIIISIIGIMILTASTAQAGVWDWLKGLYSDNLGTAVRTLLPSQGAVGISTSSASDVGKYLKVSDDSPFTYAFDTPAGGAGGSTTTIAGLQPATDIFLLTSTSGIAISTSSPATIRFNLDIATTTELAITGLAGQSGCLSVNAAGKVATSTCSGGTGITSLNSQTGGTQTFATSSDTNIHIRVASAGDIHTLTPAWAGTLADSRIASAATWNAKITTSSLSSTATGLSYDNVLGIFSWTAGYEGLKTTSSTDWNTAYADRLKWDGGATGLVAATGRTSLGLTDTATLASTTWLKVANNLSDGTASTMRTNLGLGALATGNTVPYASTTGVQATISFPLAVASTSLTGGVGLTLTTNDMACDTASASVFGCLTSADWTTFNGKQNNISWPIAYASSTHLTATLPLLITAGDLSLTGRLSTINSIATSTGSLMVGKTDTTGWYGLSVGTNGKVLMASSTATNGVNWETVVASASAGGADTNIQVNEAGAIAGYSGFTFTSSTNILSVAGQTTSTNIYSTTATTTTLCLTGDTCRTTWPTGGGGSASSTIRLTLEPETSEDDLPLLIFDATSTINSVFGVNKTNGDTITFNFIHDTSRATATSSAYKLFSSYQTNTATTTPTEYTTFASSTMVKNSILRFNYTSASSTEFMLTIYYSKQ